MAAGVSGRVSVSPPNDESYQSPGASQDDGIDRLLAQYSGLVERKEAEEGENGKEGGGGEPGMHRNHPKSVRAASGVPDQPPVTIRQVNPPSSQPTQHAVTTSPRHTVSAPTSHQTTPARTTESSVSPSGSKTAHEGLGGDVRSFSWDNLATGAVAGAEGEYYFFVSVYMYIHTKKLHTVDS